jgi:hypothetical protein
MGVKLRRRSERNRDWLMIRLHAMFVLIALPGCTSSSNVVEVSGDVSWNGAPIESGMIILQPEEPKVAPAGGHIRDGKFRLESRPGKMRVQIEAVRATDEVDPESGTRMGEMYIPVRYNSQTILEADVTIDGPNQFEFALKEKD